MILNGEDAFRAFLPAPLPQKDLYWRVHVDAQGSKWLRAPTADVQRGLPAFTATLGQGPIEVTIRHAEARHIGTRFPGVPIEASVDAGSRLNPEGEFVKLRRISVLDQQIAMRSALDNPFAVDLVSLPLLSSQPRLTAWAQETYALPARVKPCARSADPFCHRRLCLYADTAALDGPMTEKSTGSLTAARLLQPLRYGDGRC